MSTREPPSVTITLSPAQIDQVVRAATRGRAPGISALVGGSLPASGRHLLGASTDPRLSRSLVRGLSILTCFGSDGHARGIVELAEDLDMSPSTAHRYASTLVELGLLERCPQTRKYRPTGLRAEAEERSVQR